MENNGQEFAVDSAQKPAETSHFRIAFVGDPHSGKSEVRRAYVQLSSAKEKIQQVDSNVARVNGYFVELLTIDQESEFNKRVHMSRCSHLDAIILFYNICKPIQFERAHNVWIPLIKRLYEGTPLLICATGIEARQDVNEREILLRTQLNDMKNDDFDESDDSYKAVTCRAESPVGSITTGLSQTCFSTISERPSDNKECKAESAKSPSTSTVTSATTSPSKPKLKAVSKSDFRKLVTTQLGQNLAYYYGASAFKEVSYRTFEGIQSLLDDTVTHAARNDIVKYSLVRNGIGLPLPSHIYRLS